MKMIRLIFAVGLLFIGTELMAQGQGRPGRGGINPDTLQSKLNLTEDQVADFKAINESMRSKRRELFESSNGDREMMRESMMKLRAETEEEIKGILTVEQWNKYEELRSQMRENRPPRGDRGDRPKRKKKKKDTDTD